MDLRSGLILGFVAVVLVGLALLVARSSSQELEVAAPQESGTEEVTETPADAAPATTTAPDAGVTTPPVTEPTGQ